MTAQTLQGLNVLVTRPRHQQQALCDAIESLGGRALSFPLIEVVPLDQVIAIENVKCKLNALDKYQVLIFISSNAAQFGAYWLSRCEVQIPADVTVLAAGPSTAQTVSALLQCSVAHPEAGMTSEDLLNLPELKDIDEKCVAIFRGVGGRELLASTLTERGAHVEYLEVYQRQSIAYHPDELARLVDSEGIDVLTVTSAQALERLNELAGDNKAQLSLIPLIVPSTRIAELAKQKGFAHVRNANGADEHSLLTALEDLAGVADTRDED